MKNKICLVIILTIPFSLFAQELPYKSIPTHPEHYSAGTVMSRLIDGLGFRYYWATDSLTKENLDFRPNDQSRTILQTMEHIYALSNVIVNAVTNRPNLSEESESRSYDELRALTLANFKQAAEVLKTSSDEDFESYTIVFGKGDRASTFPFWNNINGPIADALWHVGQIVSHRRSAGNPFNSNVSVFTGRLQQRE